MVKRSRGKKTQEETKKQQHVIVTENNIFKEGVRNYEQKKSGKLDNGGAWNSTHCGTFLASRYAAPSTVAANLGRLLSVLILSIFCRKTFKYFVFCNNNELLFLCFSLFWCCHCCFSPLFLLIITRKEDSSNLAFLCDSDSSLHP